VRALTAALAKSKNALNAPNPWAVLAQIDIVGPTSPFCVTDTDSDVVFHGRRFQPFPFRLNNISENAAAEIRRMTIDAANVDQVIISLAEQFWASVIDPQWTVSLWFIDVTQPDQTPLNGADIYTVTSISTDLFSCTFELQWEGVTLTRSVPARRYSTSGGFPSIPRTRNLGFGR